MDIKILHIGKTGGSSLKQSFKYNKSHKYNLSLCTHSARLNENFDGKYVFFVRDPVNRFISGFISRLRKKSTYSDNEKKYLQILKLQMN